MDYYFVIFYNVRKPFLQVFFTLYERCIIVMFDLTGAQLDRPDDDPMSSQHCCLVAIGRLQVTSTPNCSDLSQSSSNASEFVSRLSMDGKITFIDQR